MKSQFGLLPIKTASLIAPLSLYFSGPTIAQASDEHVPASAPMSSGTLNYRAEVPQGSLMVSSATDDFDDGGVLYYAPSYYVIYTTTGKPVRGVENQISRSDEIPQIVTLPVGSYIVEARSEKVGYVQVHVAIKAGRRTTGDLESRENPTTNELLGARRAAPRRSGKLGAEAMAQTVLKNLGNKINLNQ